jgi:K+-sensing histidine kinase KdpD
MEEIRRSSSWVPIRPRMAWCAFGCAITAAAWDEEARSRLFTIFNRNSHSRPTGHGLGLSIVKRIVEKLGGSVGVESEGAGEGCLFFFTLPANLEPETPAVEPD